MQKLFTIIAAILLSATLWAQAPQKMSYQAVIRDASNKLVTNHSVGMRISILQGSVNGSSVYAETQTPTTNANGLVSIEIGGGAGFNSINWANNTFFIKTETDPTGGTNYTITGTSQLLSVPYAMFAQVAGNGFSGNYNDLLNRPILFDGQYNSLTGVPNLFDGTWATLTGKPNTLAGYNINDFDFTGASTNDLLKFNGSKWVKFTPNYLTSYTETDPAFLAWNKTNGISITASQVSDFQTNVTNNVAVLANSAKNSYPTADATKLAGIAPGAEVNVNADWNATNGDAQILNKPNTISGYGITDAVTTTGNQSIAGNKTFTGTITGSLNANNTVVSNVATPIAAKDAASKAYVDASKKPQFYLGQDTLGGIVFYVYTGSDGSQHGLIVSKTETLAKWQTDLTLVNANRSWDGAYNTSLMVNSPAQAYVSGLGADWYIPSIDEFSILLYNRYIVNKALSNGGFTILSNTNKYWTSMEIGNSSDGYAWVFSFIISNSTLINTLVTTTFEKDYKYNDNLVRAVRSF